MKNKWYKSKGTKTILVIAEHILATLMIVSVLCAFAYPAIAREMLSGSRATQYEDSFVFDETMQRYTNRAIESVWMKELWEVDGKYNPDKIIDIQEYWDYRTASGENTSGLAFHLKDLLEWNVEDHGDDNQNHSIIVCERKDGSYYYYTYSEFASLIAQKKLRLNGFNEEGNDLLNYLDEMGNIGDNFLQIQNEKGAVLFVNCWKYDGTYFTAKCKPVDADSILDIVNEDERWNGRLQDVYDMIYSTVYNFREYESTYKMIDEGLREKDTNYRYLYVNRDAKKIYSNCKGYHSYEDVYQYIEEIKQLGPYIVVEPLMDGFESGMPYAFEWRNIVHHGGSEGKDYLFAASVDVGYPIQDSIYKEQQNYETCAVTVKMLIVAGMISAVLWLAGLIWLTVVAGKNPGDNAVMLNRFDRWKTEIALIFTVILCLAAGACGGVLFADNITSRYYDYHEVLTVFSRVNAEYPLIIAVSTGLILIAFAIFLNGYLSLIRRIKARTLWENSLLRMVISFIGKALNHIHELWKTLLIFAGVIGIHWLAVFLFDVGGEVIAIIVMLIADILAGIYLVIYVIGRDEIEKGIRRIADGEVEYKVSTEKMLPGHKKLAEVVNEIGAGLDAAVEKSMKSERLKTDLITNVSHDIKTPLTSIINYVDLLKKENLKDPKVQHYIEVLEQKAQRLKVLTEDVVEASKVSSGNVTLEYMTINLVEMIQQTSGEFEEKFQKRNLKEILNLPDKDVIIWVDGRRTWRVLENIYNNAAKYAMEGSRVYADLKVVEGKARFELKNISEQPLNISADELTERFIRGDVSRSTEGSGLGLSIARSLTELQGGRFELYLDGDLFKVTIEFDIL